MDSFLDVLSLTPSQFRSAGRAITLSPQSLARSPFFPFRSCSLSCCVCTAGGLLHLREQPVHAAMAMFPLIRISGLAESNAETVPPASTRERSA